MKYLIFLATALACLAAGKPKPWSFEPVRRAPAPAIAARNPIDRFIRAKLNALGVQPAPQAPKRTLLRRLSLDLTGLPPTPEQSAAFLADTRPDAYDRLVEQLMRSPHYGEKWARAWLDLARYAEIGRAHV